MRLFCIHVEIPALDALLLYLKNAEQRQLDAATLQVEALDAILQQSEARLAARLKPLTT